MTTCNEGRTDTHARPAPVRSVVAFLLVLWPILAFGQVKPAANAGAVPAVDIKALDGSPVVFPKSGSKKPLLLMIGFTRKSSGDFENWNQRFKSHYYADPRIEYYELVDLQGVPSFVNGMILHGMRRAIKGEVKSHFAPFYSREDEWKRLVNYSEPGNAYLVLADASGNIRFQERGPATDEKCAEVESAIVNLLSASR